MKVSRDVYYFSLEVMSQTGTVDIDDARSIGPYEYVKAKYSFGDTLAEFIKINNKDEQEFYVNIVSSKEPSYRKLTKPLPNFCDSLPKFDDDMLPDIPAMIYDIDFENGFSMMTCDGEVMPKRSFNVYREEK